VDIAEDVWRTAMDCSYRDYKGFIDFVKRRTDINATFSDSPINPSSSNSHETQTVTFSTFKDISDLFNISNTMFDKIVTVKRVDRQGYFIGFKAVGTSLQPNNHAHPQIFCLGGTVTSWSESCKYFQREHSHKTHAGVFSAPFLRIRSKSALDTSLDQLDSRCCSQFQFKWAPTTVGTICCVGVPDSMIMGKLVLTIPYNTFNDMTMARKVEDSIKPSNDGNESDSSSSSW